MRSQLIVVVLCATSMTCTRKNGPTDPKEMPPAEQADRVSIEKSQHRMTLLFHNKPIATYRIALGRGGAEPKQRQGDHRTPEGTYFVDGRKPNSRFHRTLHLSYPSAADRERAKAAGVSPGSDIEIHGLENGLGWISGVHTLTDWTDGCIAVTNEEIDQIWNLVPLGTTVEIHH